MKLKKKSSNLISKRNQFFKANNINFLELEFFQKIKNVKDENYFHTLKTRRQKHEFFNLNKKDKNYPLIINRFFDDPNLIKKITNNN